MEFKFYETLHDCIIDGIRYVISESGLKAILFRIDLGQYIDDPAEFHRNLYSIFKEGSIVLEKAIIKELHSRLKVPYIDKGNFDFGEHVKQAREHFIKSEVEEYIKHAKKLGMNQL
jgi:hypothetical protein